MLISRTASMSSSLSIVGTFGRTTRRTVQVKTHHMQCCLQWITTVYSIPLHASFHAPSLCKPHYTPSHCTPSHCTPSHCTPHTIHSHTIHHLKPPLHYTLTVISCRVFDPVHDIPVVWLLAARATSLSAMSRASEGMRGSSGVRPMTRTLIRVSSNKHASFIKRIMKLKENIELEITLK